MSEKEICLEIETQARAFPVLEGVDEIWFAEIAFYDSSSDPSWRDAVGFNRYTDGGDQLAASMEFFHNVLISGSQDGVATITPESRRVFGG